ncbi:hypothetical protein ACFYWN_22185 [Streptomyces sp. NPDC002917]|uniref:hypothetical protein n=1 Tax=Streptomyces sp. NPDC002917 TaxID=3364671 RepID=UPI0036B4F945
MTIAATPWTYTLVGLRVDIDMSELLAAAVLPGPVADDVVILATREEGFARWAGGLRCARRRYGRRHGMRAHPHRPRLDLTGPPWRRSHPAAPRSDRQE